MYTRMKIIINFFCSILVTSMLLVSCEKTPEDVDREDVVSYTINAYSSDSTMGTVNISPKKDKYFAGESVVITATPERGYKFLNFNGYIADNPYTHVVENNMTFVANFEKVPLPYYSATFKGKPLNISGYHDAYYQTSTSNWLFIAAKEYNNTTQKVSFPYLELYMEGTSRGLLRVDDFTQLYMEKAYTNGEYYLADWLFKSLDVISCTELDMTTHKLSMETSLTMFHYSDMVEGNAQNINMCSTGILNITLSHITFNVINNAADKLPQNYSHFYKQKEFPKQ